MDEAKTVRVTHYKKISNSFVLSISFITNCELTTVVFCLVGEHFEVRKGVLTLNELKEFFIYIKNNPQIFRVRNMPKTYLSFKHSFCFEDIKGEVILIGDTLFVLGAFGTQEVIGCISQDLLINFLFGDEVYKQYKNILTEERDTRLLNTMEPVGSA